MVWTNIIFANSSSGTTRTNPRLFFRYAASSPPDPGLCDTDFGLSHKWRDRGKLSRRTDCTVEANAAQPKVALMLDQAQLHHRVQFTLNRRCVHKPSTEPTSGRRSSPTSRRLRSRRSWRTTCASCVAPRPCSGPNSAAQMLRFQFSASDDPFIE